MCLIGIALITSLGALYKRQQLNKLEQEQQIAESRRSVNNSRDISLEEQEIEKSFESSEASTIDTMAPAMPRQPVKTIENGGEDTYKNSPYYHMDCLLEVIRPISLLCRPGANEHAMLRDHPLSISLPEQHPMMVKSGIAEQDLVKLNKAMNQKLAAQVSASGIPPVPSAGTLTATTAAASDLEQSTPRSIGSGKNENIGHAAVSSLQPDYSSWEKFDWEKEFGTAEENRVQSTFRVIGGGY